MCVKFSWNLASCSEKENSFLKSLQYIFTRWYYLHFKKSVDRTMRCTKFGWNWPSGSGGKCEKFTTTTTTKAEKNDDNRQRTKLTWAFGSGELKKERWDFFGFGNLFLNYPSMKLVYFLPYKREEKVNGCMLHIFTNDFVFYIKYPDILQIRIDLILLLIKFSIITCIQMIFLK